MRECCETCRYFEDWRDLNGRTDGDGFCELDADVINHDEAEDLTCFGWEEEDQ